ncbi:hypothetical protein CgunFtcFv8_006276 [Champsocephalus gunnari]|uniref:Ankyrin repeat domain-containing protein 53 n=1 Tax=Champsocephalus gunnari TaxID=52237 RepID=A0AAN8BWY5_CHAGU|nr:hypothetical protein CgunFtcFv8_006276 [Champsocephalus gunnari]
MEPVNKSEKRRRGECRNRKVTHKAPPEGQVFPDVGSKEELDLYSVNRQGLSALHMACLYGQLATIQLLVESRHGEHGADINTTTDSGETPLHLAAAEGLLSCTETLMQAGADALARDSLGQTPLDLARIWCHREVARYLKSCMWQTDKKKEMQERKLSQTLYIDLVGMVKLNKINKKTVIDEKMTEWANQKGLPLLKEFSPRVLVSQYHTQCLGSDPKHQPGGHLEDKNIPTKQPPASSPGPWTIFTGLQPEKPLREPDLRDKVTVLGGSQQPQYTTQWDSRRHPAPDLPLDVLQRVLFPRAFPSRIASPRYFEPKDIVEVQHRGYPQGRSTSPWTEVAMHLAEVLEPGHY